MNWAFLILASLEYCEYLLVQKKLSNFSFLPQGLNVLL